jgi:flavin reductase (DIM6/NTAB) family NADH-FMN oxidoreductase RutF
VLCLVSTRRSISIVCNIGNQHLCEASGAPHHFLPSWRYSFMLLKSRVRRMGASNASNGKMMRNLTFKGFARVRLDATSFGDPDDPTILLIHRHDDTAIWRDLGEALMQAGRHVVGFTLREATTDNPGSFVANVEDLQAVLAQMNTRPAVLAAGAGCAVALAALAIDGAILASGLILADALETPDGSSVAAFAAAQRITLPTLVLNGWQPESHTIVPAVPDAEIIAIEESELKVSPDRTEAFIAHVLDFMERRQARAATEFHGGSDARTLRDAMGCFATGITIVTAHDAAGIPVGLTANSFTSVSLDPPLLLVCISNTSSSADALRAAERFGVNVLQIAQQPTSNRFASRSEDRFAATPWTKGESGVPLLEGSLVSFECKRHALHEAGDHFILVGEVTRAQFDPRRDPLLYFRGKYRRLHFA